MTTIAVVGIGQWGKNLIRCFDECTTIKYCCHTGSSQNADWMSERFPEITLTESYERILRDETVDAVVVATPVSTHATLVRRALQANKHVFVEKPLTNSAAEARSLVELAANRDLSLFTGYVFLYAPAMQRFFEELQTDPPTHIRATWQKFGSFAAPIEYSLACHDIAIGAFLYGETFTEATVTERVGIISDADILGVKYETESKDQLTASYDRTARSKQKSVIVVTESGKRYEFVNDRLYELHQETYRDLTPESVREPLSAECHAFVKWIEGGPTPPTSGAFGADVNDVLELL